jgi:trehalose 6-phosphate synthase
MSRTIIVSNRVPVPQNGAAQAGGLAVVLRDLLEKRGGLWFGWSGEISDSTQTSIVGRGRVKYATVDLTQGEHDGYYNGFSNGVLWPLLHMMPDLVTYRREDAEMYDAVNARLADALVKLIKSDDVIWIQDYHLFSLAAELRARGVVNAIGFFLHIPFPPADMVMLAPGVDHLIHNLLSADLIGFQTRNDADNFTAAASRETDARVLGQGLLRIGARVVRVGVFPVEIEPQQFAQTAARAANSEGSALLHHSLQGRHLILGVDRLDPSKGLPQRLEAFGHLLETHPEWCERVTFVQIAASSRSDVDSYRSLRLSMESIIGRINSTFGRPHWTPIRLVTEAVDRDTVAGYMRQARIGLVTPLRDGMNVVAKEYVAAQDPADPGVLVLSQFAGAADQLGAALLVNPHDADTITDALDTALRMDLTARKTHWAALWNAIRNRSARGWGDSFLEELAHLRSESGKSPQIAPASSGTTFTRISPILRGGIDLGRGTRTH